jgi:hypothetical protein
VLIFNRPIHHTAPHPMALQCFDIAQHHPTPCHSTQHSPPLLLRPIVESQNNPYQLDRGRGAGRTARLKQICLDRKSRNLVRHHNAARPVLTRSAQPVHGYVESLWIFRPAALARPSLTTRRAAVRARFYPVRPGRVSVLFSWASYLFSWALAAQRG